MEVRLRDVVDVFKELDIGNVDLFKLNIEGSEYAVLDRMIETGLISRVRYLQVQFHEFGTELPIVHRDRIREGLYKTHNEHWVSHPWKPEDGWQWADWSSWVIK